MCVPSSPRKKERPKETPACPSDVLDYCSPSLALVEPSSITCFLLSGSLVPAFQTILISLSHFIVQFLPLVEPATFRHLLPTTATFEFPALSPSLPLSCYSPSLLLFLARSATTRTPTPPCPLFCLALYRCRLAITLPFQSQPSIILFILQFDSLQFIVQHKASITRVSPRRLNDKVTRKRKDS